MNLESTELDVEFEVDPETAWLEEITIGDFRIWHIMFFAFCGFMCIGKSQQYTKIVKLACLLGCFL